MVRTQGVNGLRTQLYHLLRNDLSTLVSWKGLGRRNSVENNSDDSLDRVTCRLRDRNPETGLAGGFNR